MRILVICNSRHHSRATLALAEKLVAMRGHGEVTAVCDSNDVDYFTNYANPTMSRVMAFRARAQSDAHLPAAQVQARASRFERVYRHFAQLRAKTRSKFVRKFIDIAKETSIGFLLQERQSRRHYARQVAIAENIVEDIAPTVVLAFGDRHIDFELSVLTAAKRRGLRVLLPYGTYSGREGMYKIRKLQGGFDVRKPFSFYRAYAARALRNQIYEGIFCQRPSVLMALSKMGLLSSNPWTIGNGPSDVVCVDNESTQDRYVSEGVPAHKLRIVGDLAYDDLFASLRNRGQLLTRMIEAGSVHPDRKNIVLALPQFAEQGLMSVEEHWREIEHLLAELTRCNQNVVVSLHPRVNPADYAHLAERVGVHISSEPLKDILPIADVFVAVNSSTVFWASLCGIPSVVLDYFGLDSSLFEHLSSIMFVRDRSSISETINAALSNSNIDFAKDWKLLSRDQVFDGNVNQRYYDLVVK